MLKLVDYAERSRNLKFNHRKRISTRRIRRVRRINGVVCLLILLTKVYIYIYMLMLDLIAFNFVECKYFEIK
jgi:hypothetical protein